MLRNWKWTTVIAAVSLAGCLGTAPSGGSSTPGGDTTGGKGDNGNNVSVSTGGETTGDINNTFDHPNDGIDPFTLLQRVQTEGAPEVSTKMHSCQKLKYATVGNVLKQLGVNMAATAATSAGALYKGASQAMGAPNYGARVAEAIELTTAGATKLFDILTEAAPEILTAMPNAAACKVAGASTSLIDSGGKCSLAGISCIQGSPATQAQKDLCDNIVGAASTPAIGQTLAVATLMAAAHSCE
jgi:hypothetical protein